MKFKELNLVPELLDALETMHFEEPSPIQEKAIPMALDNQDILGCAKTGTGKTAAFALPILQKLYLRDEQDKYPRTIKALVLAPTRELAMQINETFESLNSFVNLKSAVIFGGVRQGQQVIKIDRGIDVLVATPGRLMDLNQQGLLDLSHIEYFVLDEADRMLDMGFIRDIRKIIKLIPKCRQTMMFSATLPEEIEKLVDELLNNPKRIMMSSGHMTVDKINQSLYYVDKLNKAKLLLKLLEDQTIYNAIVFVRTKRNVDTLCKKLNRAHISAEGIHGDKSQNSRVRALNNFKDNKARILVATDIAARGIDIDELTHVINFDLPEQAENYVHRIGRTARAGASGAAISFCCYQEKGLLKDIESFIHASIPTVENTLYPMEDFTIPQKKTQNKQRKKPQSKNMKSSSKASHSQTKKKDMSKKRQRPSIQKRISKRYKQRQG